MFWEKFLFLWVNPSSAKLANYLLGLNLQGLAETILFAEKKCKEDMLSIIKMLALTA
jgi:hypothetical protein